MINAPWGVSKHNAGAEAALVALFREEWARARQDWARRPSIVLLDEAYLVLTRTACRWMGLPLEEVSDTTLAHDLGAMIERTGRFGPGVVAALLRRRRVERWLEDLVRATREEPAAVETPLTVIAGYREGDGSLLTPADAAVEILNIVRPTAAIARYVMFVAMALEDDERTRSGTRIPVHLVVRGTA